MIMRKFKNIKKSILKRIAIAILSDSESKDSERISELETVFGHGRGEKALNVAENAGFLWYVDHKRSTPTEAAASAADELTWDTRWNKEFRVHEDMDAVLARTSLSRYVEGRAFYFEDTCKLFCACLEFFDLKYEVREDVVEAPCGLDCCGYVAKFRVVLEKDYVIL